MLKEKLIDKRKEKGLSQERMADLLGLDTSNYSRRENGDTKIKITEWEKKAQILNVPISEIFESEEATIYKINSKNSTGGQIGDNNSITGVDATTLDNLNEYIKTLKEENIALKLENKTLQDKLKM
jgi:transcriptional regulator with XRE-family HTH domain